MVGPVKSKDCVAAGSIPPLATKKILNSLGFDRGFLLSGSFVWSLHSRNISMMSLLRCCISLVFIIACCSSCSVVAVADAAVTVVATTVKVGATVVETTVDVAAAGVKAVAGSDEEKKD